MINNWIQIGSNNPSAWSWLDETAVNALITTHDENVSAHQDIRDQQTALSSQISWLWSAIWDKADKATTYTKTETNALIASAWWTPTWSLEIYDNFTQTSNFDTTYTHATTWSNWTWATYSINNWTQLWDIATWNVYFWALTFLTNWTAWEWASVRLQTFINTQYIKLNTLNSFEIENKVVLLWNAWWKSQMVRFWLSTNQSIINTNTDWVYIEYDQTTWVLSLKCKSASTITSVNLKTFTDVEAKTFAKIKITYDWTSVKWYVNWTLLWTISTNIPSTVNLQYTPYQSHIIVSSVIWRTFLDYFYAKFKFNN